MERPSGQTDITDQGIYIDEAGMAFIVKGSEETLCAQARNATASKTLITPTHNTTHTNPQVHGGF